MVRDDKEKEKQGGHTYYTFSTTMPTSITDMFCHCICTVLLSPSIYIYIIYIYIYVTVHAKTMQSCSHKN